LDGLRFTRPLIDSREKKTFGSVTAEDIIQNLKDQHSIVIEKSAVSIAGGRIKEIGEHVVKIKINNQPDVELKVFVHAAK
jgi:ribosomal protein L9